MPCAAQYFQGIDNPMCTGSGAAPFLCLRFAQLDLTQKRLARPYKNKGGTLRGRRAFFNAKRP